MTPTTTNTVTCSRCGRTIPAGHRHAPGNYDRCVQLYAPTEVTQWS